MKTAELMITLREVKNELGIVLLVDDKTGLFYFKHEGDENPETISNPYEYSAFEKIEICKKVVICQIPLKVAGNEERFLVYLRNENFKKGKWLMNPLGEARSFTKIISVGSEYVHLDCGVGEKGGKRVFVFCNGHWIAIPFEDVRISSLITEFEEVKEIEFMKRKSLLLKSDDRKNPFSIYFLDDATYFTVSGIPCEKNKEFKLRVFFQVFPTYVVIGRGSGLSIKNDYFYVWQTEKEEWLDGTLLGGVRNSDQDDFQIKGMFTAKHIALLVSDYGSEHQNRYYVLSTETWKTEEVSFAYNTKTSYVGHVSITEEGNMRASIEGPGLITSEIS